ncbi:MAG TPA: hypothetical protein VIW47_07490, partial [Nitrospiraceae bacterium]
MQDERGESPGSGLHSTARRPDGLSHTITLHASIPLSTRPRDHLPLKETQSTAFDVQEQAERC